MLCEDRLLPVVRLHSPVDVDSLSLPNAMGSGHGLQVVLWIPVAVEDDDRVCSGQIDAQPTGPGGQQEGKVRGARRIEVLHGLEHQIKE